MALRDKVPTLTLNEPKPEVIDITNSLLVSGQKMVLVIAYTCCLSGFDPPTVTAEVPDIVVKEPICWLPTKEITSTGTTLSMLEKKVQETLPNFQLVALCIPSYDTSHSEVYHCRSTRRSSAKEYLSGPNSLTRSNAVNKRG